MTFGFTSARNLRQAVAHLKDGTDIEIELLQDTKDSSWFISLKGQAVCEYSLATNSKCITTIDLWPAFSSLASSRAVPQVNIVKGALEALDLKPLIRNGDSAAQDIAILHANTQIWTNKLRMLSQIFHQQKIMLQKDVNGKKLSLQATPDFAFQQ